MNRLALIIGILALALLAACTEAEDAPQTTAPAAATAETAPEPGTAIADGAPNLAGTVITLGSGEDVPVISVGYFDENMAGLDGLVAIEGRVKASYPERGALILVDCENMEGCSDGCCPEAEVPVRLDIASYTGDMPAADTEVVVVGDLTVNDMGYELAVREIRSGEETLLTQSS